MTVTALEYEDRQRGWKLERTEFGPFNLLVGLSGAGKTSVLEALLEVSRMGLSQPGARHPGGERRWCIEVQADDGQGYRWEAEVAVQEAAANSHETQYADYPWPVRFVHERITKGDKDIVVRRDDEFRFLDGKLPRLKDTESAISLLREEALIAPLHRTLERMLVSSPDEPYTTILPLTIVTTFNGDFSPPLSAEVLRENLRFPILLKAYLARLHLPDVFSRIHEQYLAIFDNVTELTVDLVTKLDPMDPQSWADVTVTVAIKEHGVDGWIRGRHISSGMLRTFFHIAELEFASRGTTFVIDEYENSMGVNCLPAITELFLRRQHELQFVLTSHHPYVIQNVPIDWWRVVTRRGGVVSVRPAREIPELSTSSRQDAFTLLVNSSVYEEGIQ